MSNATAVLVDSQALTRTAFKQLLEQHCDLQIVAECTREDEVSAALAACKPQILVTELELPGASGLSMINAVKTAHPALRVLILTSLTDGYNVRAALAAGAMGYISKSDGLADLINAVKQMRAGASYVSPSLSHHSVERRRGARNERVVLSPRQREVLRMLAAGSSTKDIAVQMGVSHKTVETHRARLMQALGLKGANALVHFAVRNALRDRPAL